MLVRVLVEEIRLGMFIHALEGSWFDHPNWPAKFLLDNEADLAKLRASSIAAVIIDDSKGLGRAPDTLPVDPDPEPVSQIALPKAARRRSRPRRPRVTGPCTAAEEVERATEIVDRSKAAVREMLADIRLGKAVDSDGLVPIVDDISASIARNPYALVGIARLKTADEYTYMHSVAVCALMVNLARHLGLAEKLTRDIGMAGLLHDVGKMAVPADLLNKAGPLTEKEFALVRNHPERGHRLLARSGGVPEIALDVCLHHHERMDGTGYPHALKGSEISLYARMGAVCDVYDAVTSTRAYKPAWHPAEALARMGSWDGHFDPRIYDALVRSVGIYPVGAVVRLRSNRLALVAEECSDDLTRPVLRTFYSVADRCRVAPETVQLDGVSDRIVGPDDPVIWQIRDWPALKLNLLAGVPARSAAA
jgi:putative nucleotidyltransferase with HDIG domain